MPKRRGPAGRHLDLDDVLAGRVQPTATELLDIIHRVNPTGRELPAREAVLRYAQKALLQSLLVRRFPEELTVAADPGREGTVSLLHRGRDACHAVIAELADDARAWVQMQVDLSSCAEETPAARPIAPRQTAPEPIEDEDETPEVLVQRAERAIEQFDYDAARTALERATAASGGAPGPAAALLVLLVETLGDDAAALGLVPSLSRAALGDANVRAPLALAAARAGDEEQALSLVRGAGDPQAAAVGAALAGAALARGDTERAASFLAQAKKRDPACPALVGLAGDLGRARAGERRSAEEEIARLVDGGHDDEAARRANEVLARWPESEAAGRAMRTLAERRRRSEVERLAAEADGALAAGDTATALALMGRTLGGLARGAEREALEQRMATIEAAARARREDALVEDALRRLEAPDPREGLFAYLEIDAALRGRVRGASARREELGWLDGVAASRGPNLPRVEAVIALGRARALAASDPEGALGLVEAHLGLLERAPEARRVIEEARARAAERRVARARETAEEARAALAAGEAAATLARLTGARLADLPEEERAVLAALRARAAAAVEREARIAELGKLRSAGRLFEARALCDDLAGGEDGARWEGERRALQEAIQVWFGVEVHEEPEPLVALPIVLWKLDLEETVRALTADGRAMVLAEAHDRWVLVRVVAWETAEVVTTVLLSTPEPLGTIRIELRGPRLWIVGEAALELDVETWEVLTWRGAGEIVPPPDRAHEVLLAAPEDPVAPRFLWALGGPGPLPGTVRVIDVDRRRVARELSDIHDLAPVVGVEEGRMVCAKGYVLTVYEARGASVPGHVAPSVIVRSLAPRPDGRGLVALGGVGSTEPDGPLRWIEVSPRGVETSGLPLEDSDGKAPAVVGLSREAGMMFVVLQTPGGTENLLGFRPAGGRMEQVWRVPVPRYTLLVQDAVARRIVAAHVNGSVLHANLLGPEPPEPPAGAAPLSSSLWFPTPMTALRCGQPFGERAASVRTLVETLRRQPAFLRSEMLRSEQTYAPFETERFVDRVVALERLDADAQGEARELRAWLEEKAPAHAGVRLLRAGAALREARWDEVLSLLDGITLADLDDDPGSLRHVGHLRALASLHLGELERARDLVLAARAHEGHCDLDPLSNLVDALLDPSEPDYGVVSPAGLAGMLRTADARLAAGDAAGALEVLSNAQALDEVQTLARRAEAWLRTAPSGRRQHLHRVMVLARLLQIDATAPVERRTFPVGDATWDAARVADVVARARAWLDGALPHRPPDLSR